jgi:hypothetical protein
MEHLLVVTTLADNDQNTFDNLSAIGNACFRSQSGGGMARVYHRLLKFANYLAIVNT